MNLSKVKLNSKCVIKKIEIKNEKNKIRLMELGLLVGCEVRVIKKSLFKKTLLIVFCNSCFTLKENVAQEIEVAYA